ncbi:MAG: hypothetical protein AB7O62_16705 [Pirellulales bacterium]
MPRFSGIACLCCLLIPGLERGPDCLAADTAGVELAARPAPLAAAWRASAEPRLTWDQLTRPDNAAEAALLEDAIDGQLDRHSLLAATLIAGGADAHVIQSAERRLRQWTGELSRTFQPHDSHRDRAAAILAFLHERVFTGAYELTCSDVRRALDEGTYNCVNSTVLFNALAERLGLEVAAVECPAHVFSVVLTPTGTIDVETTCPEWFALEHQPKVQRARLAAKTGEKTAGQRWEGPRRQIGAAGLTALVYYNRGVDALEQHAFAGAVAANAKALRLDPQNPQAGGNLLASLNNWALAAAAADEHELAVRILDSGLELAPAHELFQSNYLAIHQQWFQQLTAAGRHGAVLELSRHASQRLPGKPYWRQAEASAQRGLGRIAE